MKNRSRYEILKTMLEVIQNPTNKTNIMYEVKLSYDQLIQYLKYMLANELYDFNSDNKTYTISERGKLVLDSFNRIPKINFG
jgi:predicted transcriptional regulator